MKRNTTAPLYGSVVPIRTQSSPRTPHTENNLLTTTTSSTSKSNVSQETHSDFVKISAALWNELIGPPSRALLRHMREAEVSGLISLTAMSYAIHQTADAPRPAWCYCAAILHRLIRTGYEDQKLQEVIDNPFRSGAGSRPVPEQSYTQRDYGTGNLDQLDNWLYAAEN